MTPRDIARLCCKVLAIYAFIQSVSQIHLVHLAFWGFGSSFFMILGSSFFVVQPVLTAAFGWLLWKKSGLVAAWMTGYDIQDNLDEPEYRPKYAGLKDIHSIVFSSIGLWVLITAIPALFGILTVATFYLDPFFGMDSSELNEAVGTWIALFLRLLLGGWLLFGGRGLVDLLHKLRRIGLKDETTEPPSSPEPPVSRPDP